jgi:DNA-binding transcriptional LysR family regulator
MDSIHFNDRCVVLDDLSLDQLLVFEAAAEAGSFSAAGRKLGRAQSVVSQTIATLEARLGVKLFARDGRYPVLTEAGSLLLADARAVTGAVNELKARARAMAGGLEAELSVAIDVMFPMPVLTKAAAAFGQKFPATPLRLYVEVLGGVAQAVFLKRAGLGVMGSLVLAGPALQRERLLGVRMVFVAAPSHPLGRIEGAISAADLQDHVQLVLTDRTELSKGQEFQVLSRRNWRLADLGAKHEFLRAGLGWGGMPLALVEQDLAAGRLRALALEDTPLALVMPMYATYLPAAPPGPAGRWFIEALKRFGGESDGSAG